MVKEQVKDRFPFTIKYPRPVHETRDVPIPYWGIIPGGLEEGKIIQVSGYVNHGASRFEIDFARGTSTSNSDYALHFNPRFDQRVVVRNSNESGSWRTEERLANTFPFSTGKDFEIMFLVEAFKFKIAVNGRHFVDFKHRLPYRTIDKLNIDGNIRIKRIEFSYHPSKSVLPVPTSYPTVVSPPRGISSGFSRPIPTICPPPSRPLDYNLPRPTICPPGPFYPPPSENSLQQVFNPAIPFRYKIPNGMRPGMMIYISGRPNAGATKFNIDLECASAPPPHADIAVHFNPRFERSIVVRNSYISRQWGSEERSGGFPFFPGAHFDIIILVEQDKYMFAVNGKHFAEFRHRIMPLSSITDLVIEGNLLISCVRFQ